MLEIRDKTIKLKTHLESGYTTIIMDFLEKNKHAAQILFIIEKQKFFHPDLILYLMKYQNKNRNICMCVNSGMYKFLEDHGIGQLFNSKKIDIKKKEKSCNAN